MTPEQPPATQTAPRRAGKPPKSPSSPQSTPSQEEEIESSIEDKSLPALLEDHNSLLGEILTGMAKFTAAAELVHGKKLMRPEDAMLEAKDIRIDYMVRVIGADGEYFRVAGGSNLPEILSAEMLPEAVSNFQQILQGNLIRPLFVRFVKMIETHVEHNKPKTPLLAAASHSDGGYTPLPEEDGTSPNLDPSAGSP